MKSSKEPVNVRVGIRSVPWYFSAASPWPVASPWGLAGRQFINTKAVCHLPPTMLLFIQDGAKFGHHASVAYKRKSPDPTEVPKHRIDIMSTRTMGIFSKKGEKYRERRVVT